MAVIIIKILISTIVTKNNNIDINNKKNKNGFIMNTILHLSQCIITIVNTKDCINIASAA